VWPSKKYGHFGCMWIESSHTGFPFKCLKFMVTGMLFLVTGLGSFH